MRFCANVSILFTEVPLLERFARAREAGFEVVELWWPRGEDLAAVEAAIADAGVEVALLNFDAGDMPAGDRGLISDPALQDAFRANVPVALELATAIGCTKLNALAGHELDDLDREAQLELARDNVRFAADAAAEQGAQVLIEAVNTIENGPYLLSRTPCRVGLRGVGRARQRAAAVRRLPHAAHGGEPHGDDRRAPRRDRPRPGRRRPGRGQPGTGEIDYDYVFRRLEELGYDGRVGPRVQAARGDTEASLAWLPRERWHPRGLSGAVHPTVGFIGLGVMGAPMARNLVAAGHRRRRRCNRARRSVVDGRRDRVSARARSPSAPTW